MSKAARRILGPELGTVPGGLEELTEKELSGFADMLQVAKREQSEQLEAAVDEALEIVPRLLRRTIRKILFG
ncbi:MAG TPA: hypothetical protein VIJ20_05830 [Solirubrobacteraceae bacterium]